MRLYIYMTILIGHWMLLGRKTTTNQSMSVNLFEEVFFQTSITANIKLEVAMPILNSEIMFWKRALHKYVHIYIGKALFQITICPICGRVLIAFCKRDLHIYT